MASLKLRLFLIALLFLFLPGLAYLYLLEVQRFIISGQKQSQLMMAEGIAAIMHGREDLLALHPPSQNVALSVSPTLTPKKIDGQDSDWEADIPQTAYNGFHLRLAENPYYLFMWVDVSDQKVVLRHPNYLRLDTSDALRLTFLDPQGEKKRYLLTTTHPGPVSVYEMQPDWQYATTGQHDANIQAAMSLRPGGYRMEIKFPKLYLSAATEMRLTVQDVDNAKQRTLVGLQSTQNDQDRLNKLMARSVELEKILSGLHHKQAQVWIVDGNGRVRAEQGGLNQTRMQPMSWWEKWLGLDWQAIEDIPSTTVTRSDAIVQKTLAGQSQMEVRKSSDHRAKILMAAAPIQNESGKVIGAVLIEQSNLQILALQKAVLSKLLVSFGVVILIVYGVLLWFAVSLVSRIHQLKYSLQTILDTRGRIISQRLPSTHKKDELGVLSREIELLLLKLKGYTDYLERMPKVLRHEIHNPLNVIQSALFNLEESQPDLADHKYVKSARRGLNRLESLVNDLTSASSLADALQLEEKESFDVCHLLATYVEHLNLRLAHHRIRLHMDVKQLPFYGNDHRIEQMLDKLLDNAVSFATPDSDILMTLTVGQDITLCISNEGPTIPEEMLPSVLEPMVRVRTLQKSDELHLGIGLYVVQQIVENHHGQVWIANRPDQSGVIVQIRFPRETPLGVSLK